MGQGALVHLDDKERKDCERIIAMHEGKRSRPYLCTADKITVGIGRNLEDKGLNDEEITFLFQRDLRDALHDAASLFPGFDRLSSARKVALVDMAFNLGRKRLEGFRKMRSAVDLGDFATAAREAMDSKWYRQVGQRGERIVEMIRSGRMPE